MQTTETIGTSRIPKGTLTVHLDDVTAGEARDLGTEKHELARDVDQLEAILHKLDAAD